MADDAGADIAIGHYVQLVPFGKEREIEHNYANGVYIERWRLQVAQIAGIRSDTAQDNVSRLRWPTTFV